MTKNTITPAVDRVMSRVVKTDTCWLWTGYCLRGEGGYGQITRKPGEARLVHRIVYESLVGSIPEGMQMDHLCRVRNCVNPAHLEAVTAAENNRRKPHQKPQKLKTHCKLGHPYLERLEGSRRNKCQICSNARQRRYTESEKGRASAIRSYNNVKQRRFQK